MFYDGVANRLEEKYVKRLQKMKMGESSKSCAICLRRFEAGQIIYRLPCKHILHKDCLDPWFLKQSTCPLCRLDLKQHFDQNS